MVNSCSTSWATRILFSEIDFCSWSLTFPSNVFLSISDMKTSYIYVQGDPKMHSNTQWNDVCCNRNSMASRCQPYLDQNGRQFTKTNNKAEFIELTSLGLHEVFEYISVFIHFATLCMESSHKMFQKIYVGVIFWVISTFILSSSFLFMAAFSLRTYSLSILLYSVCINGAILN